MSQYMMCGNSTTPDSALATPAPSADQASAAAAADNLAEALAGLSVSPPELPAENVSGEQTDPCRRRILQRPATVFPYNAAFLLVHG